jgi:hypothetical protein
VGVAPAPLVISFGNPPPAAGAAATAGPITVGVSASLLVIRFGSP